MQIARTVSTRATCPRASVGCVLVREHRILTTGYNGAPRGVSHCTDAGCMVVNDHCQRATHAEANAIVQAALHGVGLEGATAYCTHQPCVNCSKLLISAGVKQIVYDVAYPDAIAAQLLAEAGVGLRSLRRIGIGARVTHAAAQRRHHLRVDVSHRARRRARRDAADDPARHASRRDRPNRRRTARAHHSDAAHRRHGGVPRLRVRALYRARLLALFAVLAGSVGGASEPGAARSTSSPISTRARARSSACSSAVSLILGVGLWDDIMGMRSAQQVHRADRRRVDRDAVRLRHRRHDQPVQPRSRRPTGSNFPGTSASR